MPQDLIDDKSTLLHIWYIMKWQEFCDLVKHAWQNVSEINVSWRIRHCDMGCHQWPLWISLKKTFNYFGVSAVPLDFLVLFVQWQYISASMCDNQVHIYIHIYIFIREDYGVCSYQRKPKLLKITVYAGWNVVTCFWGQTYTVYVI